MNYLEEIEKALPVANEKQLRHVLRILRPDLKLDKAKREKVYSSWYRTEPTEREHKMYGLYQSGQTLEEVGNAFNITRERVRQILKKRFGLTFENSRRKLVVAAKNSWRVRQEKADKTATEERKYQKVFGCSKERFLALNGEKWNRRKGTKALQYYCQWQSAVHTRGIEWKITFPEWCEIWEKSGKYHLRGRGHGYCMARYGDSGAYEVGNVYICTVGENFSDSYLVKPMAARVEKRNINRLLTRAREEQNG